MPAFSPPHRVAKSFGSPSEYDRPLSIQVNAWEEKTISQVPFSSPASSRLISVIETTSSNGKGWDQTIVGGVPNRLGIGVAQDVQRRVDQYPVAHPNATWNEIYENVPSHYHSFRNM
jgi:hypothetical protein